MRGSEENFHMIGVKHAANVKLYENGVIKHIQFVDKMDAIFSEYGWSQAEYFKEVNHRLGGHNEKKPKPKPEKKPVKKSAKKKSK